MTAVAAAGGLAVALVLLAAGVGHLRHPGDTRAALRAHGLLPAATHRPVALVLGPLEVVLAAGLGAGLLGGAVGAPGGPGQALTTGSALAAVVAAVLCLSFATYLRLVQRRTAGTEVPCGCGLDPSPVTHWSVVRAALLGVFALTALATPVEPWSPVAGATVWAQVVVAVAGGLALAIATATLPSARAVPTALTTWAGGRR